MSKSHIKRIAAPRSWPIPRKKSKWITKPRPGPHSIDRSMPLSLILKDIIRLAENKREVKKILYEGKILINHIIRKDPKFPVGLMDTISIPSINKYYRILFNYKGQLVLHKINKSESNIKLSKIINKKILRGKKTQINLYDGYNKIVDKDHYKVGDSVLFDLEKNHIVEHLKLEKGAYVYLTNGKHIGTTGVIDKVLTSKGTYPSKIVFKKKNHSFETLKDYAFVIGKEKPLISLPEENEQGK